MATIEDLENWFTNRDRDSWDAFAQGNDLPTEEGVAALESEIGFRLPDEVRQLGFHRLGGLLIEAKEHLWPYPQPYDAGPAWTFQNGVMVFSLSDEAPEWLQLGVARQRFVQDYPDQAGWVPVLKRNSDPRVWAVDARGNLAEFLPGMNEPFEVDGGFYDLVLDEIAQLEQRLADKLAGKDSQA
ncbi:hypothetical protein ACQCX5_05735 [Propionibacteriaceae bacterium G57]|uniref:hypothetical protein n=1 Tax=Aestuariimicrobium sp. G57 TaxID=3418485 RepID=UPI003DA6ECE8